MRASKLKPKRIYAPRIISDHIMLQEDFERLHKFLLEMEDISEVSDDIRELIEEEWPAAKPDEVVPGNNMKPYGGITSAEDRAKVIVFLESPTTN